MKFNQIALHELLIAEENFPPFEIQFIIFRLKRIIEEEIIKTNKKMKLKQGNNNEEIGQLNIMSEMRYQDVFEQLKSNIDGSCEAHMEFWSQLIEEAPDL